MRIGRALRAEGGGAAVEMAIFLPLLVFLVAAGSFVVSLVREYGELTQISKTTARYATRAALDPEEAGVYRFRPTAGQVRAYAERLAEQEELDLRSVTVDPDPSTALPGTDVTVTITARVELGPLGRLASGLFGAFAGQCAEEEFCLRSTAIMREE